MQLAASMLSQAWPKRACSLKAMPATTLKPGGFYPIRVFIFVFVKALQHSIEDVYKGKVLTRLHAFFRKIRTLKLQTLMDKLQLRKEIKLRKDQFTTQQLYEQSLPVIQRLLAHPRLHEAHTVMLYHSLPDEVYTHTLADSLLLGRKTILLPRVTGEGTMELRRYTGPCDLAAGAYGIMEPVGDAFDDYAAIDVAVIPGVAFDQSGCRLGRGKGYYDRFLPLIPNAYKIGVCFPFQLADHIPTDSHDIRMDEVIA